MSVSIKNGFKRFGKGNLVLSNVNVNVCSGEIKTTLLSCIVGLRQLDSGQVNVGNQPRPGNLGSFCGYMPQETSLLSVLTIREVLKYFGLLYGMDMQEIEHRTHFLSDMLDLNQLDVIGFLRGGRLIVEDSPTSLLASHQSTKLADVFTHLCRTDENMSNRYDTTFELANNQRLSENLAQTEHLPDKITPLNIRRNNASIFHALFSKWWHRNRRDWRLYLGQLGIPVLCVFFMQNIIGREPNGIQASLIYNNATSLQLCGNDGNLNSSHECFSNIGICNLIDKFGDKFIWIPTNSYEDGIKQMKLGQISLLIEFPANYETHFQDRIIYRHFASNESLQGSTISVRILESGLILSTWARKLIVETYIIYLQNLLSACSISDDVIKPPLQVPLLICPIPYFARFCDKHCLGNDTGGYLYHDPNNN
ncbi:ABC transporter G family member 20 [Folsomia candida]|uniref:ABC transporter G family member 20 n=1 Tax=Folsomia candida TaxID=158441 RepID=A0A226EW00_FOLCA|nr:ABC transporter G family member 20 [Folsomia candida]